MEHSLEGLTLHVADIERSVEFYSRIPGASVAFHIPECFAMYRFGQGHIGLLKADPGFHIEIESTDLQASYNAQRVAGIEPEDPPAKRPWGETDFMVVDPDGNRIEFGEAHQRRARKWRKAPN